MVLPNNRGWSTHNMAPYASQDLGLREYPMILHGIHAYPDWSRT